jgi:hypothetical protein
MAGAVNSLYRATSVDATVIIAVLMCVSTRRVLYNDTKKENKSI